MLVEQRDVEDAHAGVPAHGPERFPHPYCGYIVVVADAFQEAARACVAATEQPTGNNYDTFEGINDGTMFCCVVCLNYRSKRSTSSVCPVCPCMLFPACSVHETGTSSTILHYT